MGVFVAPSSISASNQSRSDARVAYLDTALERSNLHVASGQMVTQILLAQDGNTTSSASGSQLQRAVGVEVSRPQPTHSNQACQNYIIDLHLVYDLGFKCQNQYQLY